MEAACGHAGLDFHSHAAFQHISSLQQHKLCRDRQLDVDRGCALTAMNEDGTNELLLNRLC